MLRLSLLLALLTSVVPSFARELAPPNYGLTLAPLHAPVTATNGNGFLTVMPIADASGRTLTPVAFPIVEEANDTFRQLLPTGGGYALVWRDAERIHIERLDEQGVVLDSLVAGFAEGGRVLRAAGWNGSEFLFVTALGRDVRVSIVAPDGSVLHDAPYDAGPTEVRVIASGRDFIVTRSGTTAQAIFIDRIASDGTMLLRTAIDTVRGSGATTVATSAGLLVGYASTTERRLHTALIAANGSHVRHDLPHGNLSQLRPVGLTADTVYVEGRERPNGPLRLYAVPLATNGAPRTEELVPLEATPTADFSSVARNATTVYASGVVTNASGQHVIAAAAFDRGYEAEVPVRVSYPGVAAQDAEDGDAERFQGLAEHLLMDGGSDAV